MILDDNKTPWKSHKKWSQFLLIARLQRVKPPFFILIWVGIIIQKGSGAQHVDSKMAGVDRTSGAEEIHHPNPPDERSLIQQTLAPLPSNHNQLRRSGASSVIYQAAKTEGGKCPLLAWEEVLSNWDWVRLVEIGSGWLKLGNKVWGWLFFFRWLRLTLAWWVDISLVGVGWLENRNDRRFVGSQKAPFESRAQPPSR